MIELTQSNNHHEIRDAIRDLCAAFPDEYFRKVDEERAYPEKFLRAATTSGSTASPRTSPGSTAAKKAWHWM